MTRKSKPEDPSRKEPHPVWREIRGIVYLLVAVFLAGSLLTYSPTDRLLWSVTDTLGRSRNLFGTAGAHLAGALFLLIGFSSFWFVVIPLTLGFLSFRGKTLASPAKTALTMMVLFVSSSAILSLQMQEVTHYRGGALAPGGLIGLHLAGWSTGILNRFGASLLFSAVFVISLMLSTRLSIGWLCSRTGLWIGGLFRRLKEAGDKRRERKRMDSAAMAPRKKPASKLKVTIVNPPVTEPKKKQEQETFPFMEGARQGEMSLPPLDLLNPIPEKKDAKVKGEHLEANARRLEEKLRDFGVAGEAVEILPGPVITMYEYKPAPGVKISKVSGLSDDLALAFRAPSIRIVAPIPGKAAIGIEIPNERREMVTLKEVLSTPAYWNSNDRLPIALGKNITGAPMVADLAKMPHLLVAGATGSGKSVSINTMVLSILFRMSPDSVRFLMVDPKRIELSIYHDIPHLLHPVVTEPKEATKALRWAVAEMERRYMLLSDRGVRHIEGYNAKLAKDPRPASDDPPEGTAKPLPYIIVVIDELADLMMTSSREVEEAITRLAQMARAAGIHLIIATQRPSVDVLTGIIKANFPTRISFQVSSKVDSRTILDTIGAEHLLGEGDMLFMPPGVGRITRIHGPYVSEEEIKRVTDFLRSQRKPDYDPTILSEVSSDGPEEEEDFELDEKYKQAIEVVIQTGQASISMLQRRLRVGYNRAARMIEVMEREGIVGPSDGVRAREVYGRK